MGGVQSRPRQCWGGSHFFLPHHLGQVRVKFKLRDSASSRLTHIFGECGIMERLALYSGTSDGPKFEILVLADELTPLENVEYYGTTTIGEVRVAGSDFGFDIGSGTCF